MKFHIRTFGCQMNRADSAALEAAMVGAGHEPADGADGAQVLIFNTCAVRAHAEERLFQHLAALRERAGRDGLVVGLVGCVPALRREALLREFPFLAFLAGPEGLADVPDLVAGAASGGRHCSFSAAGRLDYAAGGARTDAFLPVMTGCDNFCSYCVVPYARGREASRPSALVLAEAARLCRRGAAEITLLGQNVNSYRDGAAGLDFPALLAAAAGIPGLKRLGFLTSHPKDVSGRLFETMDSRPAIYRHLHLPLQSGSDRVLAAMNRGYTAGHYRAIAERARATVAGLALTSDLIVGFPGESEADFAATLELVAEIGFDDIYAFKYSDRPGTAAAGRADKIPETVKAKRLARLWETQAPSATARNRALEGSRLEVLGLRKSARREGFLVGRGENGKKVLFRAPDDLVGEITPVLIVRADQHLLYGSAA